MPQYAILRFEKHKGNPARPLEAQADRQNGYQGRNARDVLADMERVIGEAEAIG